MTRQFTPAVGRLVLGYALTLATLPCSAVAAYTVLSVPTHPHPSARIHHHAAITETAKKPATAAKPAVRRAHAACARHATVGNRAGQDHGGNALIAQHSRRRGTSKSSVRKEIAAANDHASKSGDSAPLPPVVHIPLNDSNDANDSAEFAQDQQVAAYAPEREETLRGRIENLFAPLRGSHESLVRQNQRAEQDGLTRVLDDADIVRQVKLRKLVPLPVNEGLRVDDRLPANRRYTRPWTAKFLLDLAHAHTARFDAALQVNSAVRTVEFQKHLIRINGNAAPADGDDASSHLMGGTVDLAKREMSQAEIQWVRAWLWPLQQAGKIDVEEEFQQSCFHIAVYKAYLPQLPQRLLAVNAHPRLRVPQPLRAEN